jgi:multidrug efflux pump subunit AcrA (membrane-fusion protein)
MTPQPTGAHPETPAVPPHATPDLQSSAPAASVLPVLAALDGANGSSGRPSRRAKESRWSKRTRLFLIAGAIVLVLASTVAAYYIIEQPGKKRYANLVTAKVERGSLPLEIIERGQLESANNSDIVCQVKAKSQGSTVATTIRSLVDDGTRVKYDRPKEQVKDAWVWEKVEFKLPPWDLPVIWATGVWRLEPVSEGGRARCVRMRDEKTGEWVYADLVIELDDSSLQDQLVTERITLDGAANDELQADKSLESTLSQNATDIQKAEADVKVAEINLKKYIEGDYLAKYKDYDGQIKDAQAKYEQQIERVAWANRMLKKGFQTASQAQSEQLTLESLQLGLGKAQLNMKVLVEYEKQAQEIDLKAKLATAQATLANVKSQAVINEAKARSLLAAKRSVHAQEQNRCKDMLDQIHRCKIATPRSGIAVYYIPEQARWGVGARQSIVAQGESVNEGQKMMQIPDLDHMLVTAKVHEALAPKVHRGQDALVRAESFYDQPLTGKVEFVATVAAAESFLSADVRVYTTKIAIDNPIEGLRPGSNAEVAITIGDAITDTLKVPLEAVVGGSEMGKTRKVFVLTADGPKERKVVIGASNATHVQIKEGLEEGEEVVLNPKVLVGDKVKTRKPGEGNGGGPENQNGGPGKPGKKPGAAPGSRPGAGSPGRPGAGGPGGPGGGVQIDPKQMEEMRKATIERFRKAPKEQRKGLLLQIPEQWREQTKQAVKGAGIEIPD